MPSARPMILMAAAAVTLPPMVAAIPASSAEPVTCHGRHATIVGTDGKDEIVGTRGPDVIHTLKGIDVVNGRGGRDVICGGKGGDTLAGGPGADRLFGGRGGYVGDDEGTGIWYGNKLVGGLGKDYLSGGPDHDVDWPDYGSTPDRVDFPGATGPITVRRDGTVTGPGIGTDILAPDLELIVGTPYADTMTTVGARSDLSGGEGPDSLRVTKGRVDIALDGGPGRDQLDGSRAKKWMVLDGGAGDDVLLGSRRADNAAPGAGDDRVAMGAGNDQVYGNISGSISGVDRVTTGAGNDNVGVAPEASGSTVILGPGRDTLASFWDLGEARVDAAAGTFRVDDAIVDFTGAERYTFNGGGFNDFDAMFLGSGASETVKLTAPYIRTIQLLLRGGNDTVRIAYSSPASSHVDGGSGDDEIVGSRTDDDLLGGAGNDTIDGKQGTDHCVAEQVTNCES